MKTIRTISGIRKIEEAGDQITLFKVREILYDHRKKLIERILSDVNAYIEYKFQLRVTGRRLNDLADKLKHLSNSTLDLERYEPIFEEFKHAQSMVLSNVIFYQEIDELIDAELNSSQLKFA